MSVLRNTLYLRTWTYVIALNFGNSRLGKYTYWPWYTPLGLVLKCDLLLTLLFHVADRQVYLAKNSRWRAPRLNGNNERCCELGLFFSSTFQVFFVPSKHQRRLVQATGRSYIFYSSMILVHGTDGIIDSQQ